MESSHPQIVQLFRDAYDILEQSQLPDDLRGPGFEKAVDLLSKDSLSPGAQASGVKRVQLGAEAARIERLSLRLGIAAELLEEVYDARDDELQLVIPRSKLPADKAPAIRMLSLLFTAARQAGGYDAEWTSVDLIREQCRQFGILDTSNFATVLSTATDYFVVRGRGQQREVKVTRSGYEEASKIVRRLVGESK